MVERKQSVPEAVPGGSETILLVEDEGKLRTVIAAYLKRRGYTIVEATNAADCIRLAQEYAGPIHLLITDMVLPEVGGIEIARTALAARPQLTVIYKSRIHGPRLRRNSLRPEQLVGQKAVFVRSLGGRDQEAARQRPSGD